MRYTKNLLPSAQIPTSTIGLGAAAFGYMYNKQSGPQEAIDIIKEAYACGVNYFDTAPWYGFNTGCSEKPFAEALRGIDRSSFIMATKVGWYGGDVKPPWDFRAERIEAGFKRSLEFLQMDYVDLLQVHQSEILLCDSDAKFNMIFTETLPALDRLRQRGLVRNIGVTAYNLATLKQIIERSPIKIDTVLSWTKLTLVNGELKEYVPWLKERRLGVITASPLGRGCLVSDENAFPRDNHFHQDLRSACKVAREMCVKANVQIEKLALGYCIEEAEKCGIAATLTGPSSLQELRTNLGVYENGLTPYERNVCEQLRSSSGPFGPDLKHRGSYVAKIEYMEHMETPNERLVM